MTIQEKYDTFVRKNKQEPHYAVASVIFKDSLEDPVDNLSFKLSCDDDGDDENTFYYTNGVNDLVSLTDVNGVEDFFILESTIEFY